MAPKRAGGKESAWLANGAGKSDLDFRREYNLSGHSTIALLANILFGACHISHNVMDIP
jgi:hypothetical protein